jgi:hypothetical protein
MPQSLSRLSVHCKHIPESVCRKYRSSCGNLYGAYVASYSGVGMRTRLAKEDSSRTTRLEQILVQVWSCVIADQERTKPHAAFG